MRDKFHHETSLPQDTIDQYISRAPTSPRRQPRATAATKPFQNAEASASTSHKSFTLPMDFKPAAVKLDNIELLEGQHNYTFKR